MGSHDRYLSTRQYSELSGIPIASVTKLLRQGKIKGDKFKGKWLISESEIKKDDFSRKTRDKTTKSALPANRQPKTAKQQYYSIEQFSEMTYLTPVGVLKWLKNGRLTGKFDEGGTWKVDSRNLESACMKNLIRN